MLYRSALSGRLVLIVCCIAPPSVAVGRESPATIASCTRRYQHPSRWYTRGGENWRARKRRGGSRPPAEIGFVATCPSSAYENRRGWVKKESLSMHVENKWRTNNVEERSATYRINGAAVGIGGQHKADGVHLGVLRGSVWQADAKHQVLGGG